MATDRMSAFGARAAIRLRRLPFAHHRHPALFQGVGRQRRDVPALGQHDRLAAIAARGRRFR